MDKFTFQIALPVLLFRQLATSDFLAVWDGKFVLFCFVATLLSIALSTLVSRMISQSSVRGEFIQASYRSSAALLGIAYIENLYGSSSFAPLMIIGAVPLYNIMAVVVLSLTDPKNQGFDQKALKRTLKGIITNPIIIGIVFGMIYAILPLPMPEMINNTLSKIGALSSPMGLMAMGASLDFSKVGKTFKMAVVAALMKLFAFEMIFLPMAITLGFRKEKLVAILIMLGSATTVSCYVMARNMHHEGTLTATTVALTTVGVSFSLTFWIFLMRTLALI